MYKLFKNQSKLRVCVCVCVCVRAHTSVCADGRMGVSVESITCFMFYTSIIQLFPYKYIAHT